MTQTNTETLLSPRTMSNPSILQFLPLLLRQSFNRQQMPRTPEPDAVTDAAENVVQYDQVMTTKLAIAYALALEVIYRARPVGYGGSAIDLACGPGHFSLCLAKHLQLDQLVGVDLSRPMVEVAQENAKMQTLRNVDFQVGDVTDLAHLQTDSCNLTCFTDAAHHMPDLKTVESVLIEMDRITKPDGLVVAMDLVRLRTPAITERYVRVLGHDYIDRGLPQFYEDFHNSMYAAWTADELARTCPRETRRRWYHLVARGIPSVQFLVGLPERRTRLYVRRSPAWTKAEHPVLAAMQAEWKIARRTLFWGSRKLLTQCL